MFVQNVDHVWLADAFDSGLRPAAAVIVEVSLSALLWAIDRRPHLLNMLLGKLGVHPRRLRCFVKKLEHLGAKEDVLVERNGANFGDDDLGIAAHFVEPSAELLGV